jgi:hypothetical protein
VRGEGRNGKAVSTMFREQHLAVLLVLTFVYLETAVLYSRSSEETLPEGC